MSGMRSNDDKPCVRHLQPNETSECFCDSALHNRASESRKTRCHDCSHPVCSVQGCETCVTCRDPECWYAKRMHDCKGDFPFVHAQDLPSTSEQVRYFKCTRCAKLPPCRKCKRLLGASKFSKVNLQHFENTKTKNSGVH